MRERTSYVTRTLLAALLLTAAVVACGDVVVAGGDVPPAVEDAGPSADSATPGPDVEGPAPDVSGPDPDSGAPPRDIASADVADSDEPPECWEQTLEPAYGAELVEPFTLEASDDFSGSCGGEGSKDLAYLWVVPFTDWFVLDTEGADFDTVLYLLEDACDGAEVACNNDLSEGEGASRIVEYFDEGDRYLIVVDGNSGARGQAVLSIQAASCPSLDVGDGSTLPQSFTMGSAESVHGGDCGGTNAQERSIRFTPSDAGLWRFSATADPTSDLNTALYVEQGAICGGPPLQCNGHDQGSIGMPAEVSRYLEEGESVTIIVDSRSGAGFFEFEADLLADDCPALDNGGFEEGGLDIWDHEDKMTSSCGENADIEWGDYSPYPDVLVTMDDLEPGSATYCQLDVRAGFPFSLAIVDGECAGAELACLRSDPAVNLEDGHHVTYPFPRRGGRFTAVVSPTAPEWGGWTSSMVHFEKPCAVK